MSSNFSSQISRQFKIIILICLSFITMVSYQNCSPSKNDNTQETTGPSATDNAAVDSQKAMVVLTTKCSSCHDATTKAGGVDVLSVDDMLAKGVVIPGEPSLSPLFTAIQAGRMPPAPNKALSQTEVQAINNWIQDGFKEAPVVVAPPPPTVVPLAANFNSINLNILKPKCLGCHNSTNSSGGVSYSTYTTAMNTVQRGIPTSSSLYTSTATRRTMPRGGTALTTAETKAISDWILAGALNN